MLTNAEVGIPNGELLTVADAAHELRLTPTTIRNLEKSGKLRGLKTRSGQRLFFREDVEALRAQRQGAAA